MHRTIIGLFGDRETAMSATSCIIGSSLFVFTETGIDRKTLGNGLAMFEVWMKTARRVGHERKVKIQAWMEGFEMAMKMVKNEEKKQKRDTLDTYRVRR